VTKDISGYVFGASLVATNAKDDCSPSAPAPQPYCFVRGAGSPLAPQTYEGGKNTVVLSVAKTF